MIIARHISALVTDNELFSFTSTESSEHRRAVYRQWIIIQDIIWDAKKWPNLTRRLFWKQNVKHFERLLLAAFAYVNGLKILNTE